MTELPQTRSPTTTPGGVEGPPPHDAPTTAEDETGDRSATLARDSMASGTPPRASQTRGDPATIGRYRVIRRLGQGGFGTVYLARDDELDRYVALKVPGRDRVAGPEHAEAYLAEARSLARLDHPHVVPVYDVGRTCDGLCYVVSKYVEGIDLAGRLRQSRPTFRESAALVATVAEALHHAHTRGLVHRDIKPANILLDASGTPYVADFGLALRDEDYGKASRLAGTPSYMSPEQARGEGHRVDGRSDVFSLGVVFYEMLTGRKPFRGDTASGVMEEIARAEERPLRQVDDTIPRELERICQKMLAKRASERYGTARDVGGDLHHYLRAGAASGTTSAISWLPATARGSTAEASWTSWPARAECESCPAAKVVPKGLRSFDRNDADFFLELLPGPRDRDGLPDSLRFWKSRVEATDPDAAFHVGLIYGPSGCGKSSLVKAGLLPRLAGDVVPVYIEATPDETEMRLSRALHKACPDLPPGLGLVEILAALRRGEALRGGRKVLVVLDQFEQWLLAGRNEADTELVAALRQCDGEHVQAIVLVRDDFWLAASRFMHDLEIRLVEGENSALVDLFDPPHARKVLAAFGRAYGALPERAGDLSPEQRAFLDQSVAGLAQDGKVISVRLALFAEMVKGKPWTPATLRAVGGTQGVGVTFLEETFGAATAPPEHRLHQKAAQAVLKALLPQTGTDIKGQMRSVEDLREAAGYVDRPRDFDDVLHILDAELRLITPTDPEGAVGDGAPARDGGRYYQLTHDYLVHSLRDWLTRKQRETRRGRAELRLAERAALWAARPENRHLPSALEWAGIRAWTRPKDWTEPQRRMMTRAGRVHGLRALSLAAAAALVLAVGFALRNRYEERNRATAAAGLVQQLLKADTPQVPGILKDLDEFRRWADPELRRAVADGAGDARARLHARLALLPVDAGQAAYLEARLLDAAPAALPVIRDALAPHRADLGPRLWGVLEAAGAGDRRVLPAAAALATYEPESPRWAEVGGKVGRALVAVNPVFLGQWLDALRPVRAQLTAPLAAIFRDPARPETEHSIATSTLADFAADDPATLADLLMDADTRAYASLFPVVQRHAEQVLPTFQAELARTATFDWIDRPLDRSWTEPDAALVARIEAAGGLVAERFAVCQMLPLDEFQGIAEGLRPSGYRPTRFRPYADGPTTRVAAVWTRDGRAWRVASGQTPGEVRKQDDRNRAEKLIPIDVAGYATTTAGQTSERYAALWVEATTGDEARLYLGASDDELVDVERPLDDAKLIPRTLHAFRSPDDRLRYSGVWGKPPSPGITAQGYRDLFARDFAEDRVALSDRVLVDIAVAEAGPRRSVAERARAAEALAGKILRTKPGDLDALMARARARLRLGENVGAFNDLDAVLARSKDDRDALADLEGALRKNPGNLELRSVAAAAFSLASRAVGRIDGKRGRALAGQSLALLEAVALEGDLSFNQIDGSLDFDPLRDDPAFLRLFDAGHRERRLAAVWTSAARFEAATLDGLDPDEHLRRGRELAARGYRPVAWSVARVSPEGPLISASAWHRPLVPPEALDQLARRQARGAVALVRLGKAESVWPLLRHGADPRLRSFLVNWLQPLGVDGHAVAAALDRIDPDARPAATRGQAPMEAVLFHPETSSRRALILALGTYGVEGLSPGEREALAARLLAAYRDDPDAGVHGAAAWTLRQWGLKERLGRLDAELAGPKDPGGRRWYVNGQGQTFAVIDGPVEFRMGAPADEPERAGGGNDQPPRRTIIPRRFAIATTEVTIPQFQAFLRTNTVPRYNLAPSILDKYSPDSDGPWIAPDWYTAAHYCNWLSEREGLPKDQWCYVPAGEGGYADGMTAPADLLRRTGYRLPTEAEWEYACRSGTMTSRYYGASTELLGRYGHYQANSRERAWSCGSLLPNDLGLFDMLGNVSEWVHDRQGAGRPGRHGIDSDDVTNPEVIADRTPRLLRGGTFLIRPANVRSANRDWNAPSNRYAYLGFRPARTCP